LEGSTNKGKRIMVKVGIASCVLGVLLLLPATIFVVVSYDAVVGVGFDIVFMLWAALLEVAGR